MISKKDILVTDFKIDMDAIHQANIDSLLVESGTTLAYIEYKLSGSDIVEYVSLEVRGNVRIFYKEKYYYHRSEFIPEIVEILKRPWNEKRDWYNDCVLENNWCELIASKDGSDSYGFTEVVDGNFGETESEVIDYLSSCIIEIWK